MAATAPTARTTSAAEPREAAGGVGYDERVRPGQKRGDCVAQPALQLREPLEERIEAPCDERRRLTHFPPFEPVESVATVDRVCRRREAVDRVRGKDDDLACAQGGDRARDDLVLVTHVRPSTTRSRPARSFVTRTRE